MGLGRLKGKGDKAKLDGFFFDSEEGRREWLRRAQIACSLKQPAIVEVLDLGRLPVDLPLLDPVRAAGIRHPPLRSMWQAEWIGPEDSEQLAKLLLRADGTPLKVREKYRLTLMSDCACSPARSLEHACARACAWCQTRFLHVHIADHPVSDSHSALPPALSPPRVMTWQSPWRSLGPERGPSGWFTDMKRIVNSLKTRLTPDQQAAMQVRGGGNRPRGVGEGGGRGWRVEPATRAYGRCAPSISPPKAGTAPACCARLGRLTDVYVLCAPAISCTQLATLDAALQAFVPARTSPRWPAGMLPLKLFQRRLQQSMFTHTYGAVLPCFKSIYQQQREECVADVVELAYQRWQHEYQVKQIMAEERARVSELEQSVKQSFR